VAFSSRPVSGTAVLEYDTTETLPPVGAILKRHARLYRPGHQASRAQPRGKPGFSTLDSSSGRETDCPLEGSGFEPSVPLPRLSSIRAVRAEIRAKYGCLSARPRVRCLCPPAGSPALFFKGRPVPGNAEQGDEPSCGGGKAGQPDCSLRWRPARQDAAPVARAHRAADRVAIPTRPRPTSPQPPRVLPTAPTTGTTRLS
jgi:hypothetical protein